MAIRFIFLSILQQNSKNVKKMSPKKEILVSGTDKTKNILRVRLKILGVKSSQWRLGLGLNHLPMYANDDGVVVVIASSY